MAEHLETPLPDTLLRPVLDRLPLAVTVIDPEGRMLYYNERSRAVLDRRPELLGQDVRACHARAESNAKIDRMLQEFREGRSEPFSYEADRYGKRLAVTFTPLTAGGRLLGCLQTATVKGPG